MKTILLLMCGLFLISQVSFGKEMNTKASAGNNEIKLERSAFKNSSVSKKTLIERNRVWLNFSNAEGAFKQLLVGYITGATNGWDKLYDAVTLDSNPYVDFYSINGGKRLTIQGRGLPFLTTDEVPLGYKTTIVGTFNITIDHVDGLFVNQDVFLKDLVTGVTHNLKNGTYSFTTLAGRFDDRFVLLYVNSTPVVPPAAPPIEPTVTVPEVPTPTVTEPVVPVPAVTEPVVTVPVVPAPTVTEPVATVPVVPVPAVTEPVVTVPVVPVPAVTEPVVTVPVVPAPAVTEPVVTVPVVPAPAVTEPVVTVPVVPVPAVTEPVVTVPVVPVPTVTEPVITVPVVPAPAVTEPTVTIPEVPTPAVTEPVTIVPEVPAPVVTEPIATVPEDLVPIAVNTLKRLYSGKGNPLIVSVENNEITINSAEASINEIFIYSMGQKQLFEKRNINTNEYVINDLGVAKQVLIIKTQLKNGKWTTSKVIL
ncbi:hypothetical protein CLU83_3340 [Flavobacterium sp. 1]|uniref:hypothetical protein n=1 Tax=Flavobacterium sp. 1 TaxID=2035200 RepID=UPI000C24ECA0|nr:hypothetical protein [Flavobacterium sp. 1]PJJ09957.1 hypothetical protein CLU83_3340 [Flavobacterium sp. 1]